MILQIIAVVVVTGILFKIFGGVNK